VRGGSGVRPPKVEATIEPRSFPSPAAFRAWLEAHHADADELWVGYHKRATGTPSLTWPESVDEALCYGWIDGLRRLPEVEIETTSTT
jgi:uncharacterized protein YdeI (YjbR/CyaY-like superfamily)